MLKIDVNKYTAITDSYGYGLEIDIVPESGVVVFVVYGYKYGRKYVCKQTLSLFELEHIQYTDTIHNLIEHMCKKLQEI